MIRLHNHTSIVPQQRGAVLITGLMLMAVLTIVVATAMSSTILQERMGGNLRDRGIAFQRGELAFQLSETVTMQASPLNPFSEAAYSTVCDNGFCRNSAANADWVAIDWDTKGIDAGNGTRYLVKFIGYASGSTPTPGTLCDLLFHITARAPGNRTNTFVYLQTIYRLRAGTCVPGI